MTQPLSPVLRVLAHVGKWALGVIGCFALFHGLVGMFAYTVVGGSMGAGLFMASYHMLGFVIALVSFWAVRKLRQKLQENEQGER